MCAFLQRLSRLVHIVSHTAHPFLAHAQTPRPPPGCGVVNTTAPCGNVAPLTPSPAPPTAGPTQSPTTSSQLTVECGVVLEPSISNWAMGQCGNRTTADPRVFGPYTWRTLHRFMQHYPLSPSAETQEACVRFVNALPWLIPCPHCGYDFSQFIVDNIVSWGGGVGFLVHAL